MHRQDIYARKSRVDKQIDKSFYSNLSYFEHDKEIAEIGKEQTHYSQTIGDKRRRFVK